MTSTDTKRKYFNYGFNANQTKAWNPGNTEAEINPVFDVLMTFTTSNDLNDLQKWKYFNYGFMHIN